MSVPETANIWVTGGCGFIGSNFIRHALRERPGWRIRNLDALTYAGNLANLEDLAKDPRYEFTRVDIGDRAAVHALFERSERPDAILNFAAESHVDRSILGPEAFIRTNVSGTFHLLDEARRAGGLRFVQVSTDEVYGSLGAGGKFTETTPLDPTSPYSASKASADLLVGAYQKTFRLDAVITRCSNNYGPYQFPEKLIPLMILNALKREPLPVYGNGQNVRDWIHVEDHCSGILAALERGKSGEVYNFGGESERTNLAIVEQIALAVAGDLALVRFVEDRPGHDLRYAMDIRKARAELGWAPKKNFQDGLRETIEWYIGHEHWWRPILSNEYQQYYERWYGGRLQAAAGAGGGR